MSAPIVERLRKPMPQAADVGLMGMVNMHITAQEAADTITDLLAALRGLLDVIDDDAVLDGPAAGAAYAAIAKAEGRAA